MRPMSQEFSVFLTGVEANIFYAAKLSRRYKIDFARWSQDDATNMFYAHHDLAKVVIRCTRGPWVFARPRGICSEE